MISDSALAAVQANPEPLAILGQGFDLQLDVGVCRRLTGTSCPDGSNTVPTVIDLVHSLGSAIGPTVVVEVGYDDFADTFPASVEEVVTALLAVGTAHILWVNMSERRPQYAPMNQVLAAAAGRHPELTSSTGTRTRVTMPPGSRPTASTSSTPAPSGSRPSCTPRSRRSCRRSS